mmetsp:Transcript_16942/g.29947  ORF Transcript_16942/g.29947 Transcript_16942/m.29947 type:complete len:94 (-) Transcript_16942:306-587(-)
MPTCSGQCFLSGFGFFDVANMTNCLDSAGFVSPLWCVVLCIVAAAGLLNHATCWPLSRSSVQNGARLKLPEPRRLGDPNIFSFGVLSVAILTQ